MIQIREELPQDQAEIRSLNELAFGRPVEAQLVDRLREQGAVVCSLVATEDGRIVGHILFSRVFVKGHPGASLAPMAVLPERQRQGVGSDLVRAGLETCRERGDEFVVVLGHPEYYPRFGFSAKAAEPLECRWGTGEAWMALELKPGSLEGVRGRVRYPAAFDVVG